MKKVLEMMFVLFMITAFVLSMITTTAIAQERKKKKKSFADYHPEMAERAKGLRFSPNEARFFRLPFITNAAEALAEAKKTGRPIFCFAYIGGPYGRT